MLTSRQTFLLLRLGICVVAVALFLLLADLVKQDNSNLTQFDHTLSKDMADFRNDVPVLRFVFRAVTILAARPLLTVLVPFVAVMVWLGGHRNAAIFLVACSLGTFLCNKFLKEHYQRPRPDPALRDAWVYESTDSFPSGHSSSAMSFFGLIGYLCLRDARSRRQRFWAVTGAGLVILAVGFSRIYLGAHYFSDVLGGFLLGLVWLMVGVSAISAFGETGEVRRGSRAGL